MLHTWYSSMYIIHLLVEPGIKIQDIYNLSHLLMIFFIHTTNKKMCFKLRLRA